MTKPEVVFVFPQYEGFKRSYAGSRYHLGTGYIRAFLQEHGIETVQLISPPGWKLQELVDRIAAFQSPVVGFTCYDKSYYICKVISHEIKKKSPGTKIVFGGPTPSSAYTFIMEDNPAIDVCVRHEGELTMLELVTRWNENKSIEDVKGITYRTGNQIKVNPDQIQLSGGQKGSELDCFPSPFLGGMLPVEENAIIELVSARGCPYKCTFCNNSLMAQHKIRRHSIDRIIEELRFIASAAKNVIAFFVDDAFSIDVERAKEICRRIIKENFKTISFICQTRIDYADEELFSLFVEAGFKEVCFGLDSASPRILNIIKKIRNRDGAQDNYQKEKDFLKKYKENVKLAQSKGLRANASIILGLPTDTPEDTRITLDFVKNLDVSTYTHNILQVFTGTELSQTLEEYGMKSKPGPFILPYTVEFTYDVYDIPHLPNSANRITLAEVNSADNKSFLKVSGAVEESEAENRPVQVYLEQIPDPSTQLCRWLGENISLDTQVFFSNEVCSEDDYLRRIKKCADARVPLIKYNQLRKHPGKAAADEMPAEENSYRLNDVVPELRKTGDHIGYNIMTFSQAQEDTGKRGVNVLRISTGESLDLFIEEMEDMALFEVIDLDASLKDFYFLEDKCRWSQCLCRGVKLQGPVIDGEENIRPCLSGGVVGSTAEPGEVLRNRLKELQAETEKRRGCAQCEVRFECSRCLFLPDFLEEEEYCSLRREFPQLYKAVEAKQIASQLAMQIRSKRIKALQVNELQISGLNSRMFYREEEEEQAATVPCIRKGFVMIRLNDNFFLYDINRVKLLRMNDKMAAIFELLESRSFEPGYAKAWLTDKFGLPRAEAENMLSTAMNLFRQLNVVSDE